jgi:hypothetical protein
MAALVSAGSPLVADVASPALAAKTRARLLTTADHLLEEADR